MQTGPSVLTIPDTFLLLIDTRSSCYQSQGALSARNPWSNHDSPSHGARLPGSSAANLRSGLACDSRIKPDADDFLPPSARAGFNQKFPGCISLLLCFTAVKVPPGMLPAQHRQRTSDRIRIRHLAVSSRLFPCRKSSQQPTVTYDSRLEPQVFRRPLPAPDSVRDSLTGRHLSGLRPPHEPWDNHFGHFGHFGIPGGQTMKPALPVAALSVSADP